MYHATDIDPAIAGKCQPREIDAVIGRLADCQHAMVSRWQLLRLGIAGHAIEHRVERHRLFPCHAGVYSVGRSELSREGRLMAAVLAGGPGAVLSDRSAGGLWRIHRIAYPRIEVTVPRQRRSRDGIAFHTAQLPPDEVTTLDGIPVTTVPRTLFDLAAVLRPRQLERALNEAELLRLYDHLTLDHLLTRYPRRPGSKAIRAALHARRTGEKVTRSELELRFLEFLDQAGLPEPETNTIVEGFEVDCVWRDQRVIVELDSRAFHLTRAAFEADRERDRVLQAAGWRPVRVTSAQLDLTPTRSAADLRRLLSAATLTA
jgi:very-short-patch-repair endonuclease